MSDLTKAEVVEFLKKARPDIKDWDKADCITVLTWAIPTYQAWKEKGFLDSKNIDLSTQPKRKRGRPKRL
jgi:hypothetical protein